MACAARGPGAEIGVRTCANEVHSSTERSKAKGLTWRERADNWVRIAEINGSGFWLGRWVLVGMGFSMVVMERITREAVRLLLQNRSL